MRGRSGRRRGIPSRPSLLALVAVVAVASTVAVSAVSSRPLRAQETPSPIQSAQAGSRVFGSAGCSGCHAIDGLGGDVGPDLGRLTGERSFFGLAAAMWNHLPGMRQQMRERGIEPRGLRSRDVGDLIAFLYTVGFFDPEGDPERGASLFFEKRCVACHQVEGVGGVVGPNLDYLGEYRSPISVAAALWNHGPNMLERMRTLGIRRPTFTGQELVDLIVYLESRGKGPAEGGFHALPGDARNGGRLFREKSCARCHGAEARGGIGPDLVARDAGRGLIGFAAAMWNKTPAMAAAMRQMRIDVPRLTPSEMADLVAYLRSVRYFATSGDPSRGRRVLGTAGCFRCHTSGERGEGAVADLAGVRGLRTPAAVIAVMWNHIAVSDVPTTGWPTLTATQMADLSAFFESVSTAAR